MDYFNAYERKMGIIGVSNQERFKNRITNEFNRLLNTSPDVCYAVIDNKEDKVYKVLIIQTTNPLNENKEERKLMCSMDTPIHRGSVIKVGNDIYIITADIDSNGVYQTTKMQKANYTIKMSNTQPQLGKVPVVEIPAIVQNYSMYTDGVQEGKLVTTLDTKVNALIPANDFTKTIQRKNRIIISKGVYEVTMIDDYSKSGLLAITMTETESNSKDDFQTGIADNTPHIFTIETIDTLSLAQDGTSQLNVVAKDNGVIVDNPQLTYISSNTDIATVSTTGLITAVASGMATISVTYQNVTKDIGLTVVEAQSTPTDNFTYTLTGDTSPDTSISAGYSKTYTAKKLNNGVEVAGQFDFEIIVGTTPSSAYKFTVLNDTQCKIECIEYVYNITLRAKDKTDNTQYIDKPIKLKSIF